MTVQLTKRQWEYEVKRSLRNRKISSKQYNKVKLSFFKRKFQSFAFISYPLGALAIFCLWYFYGWRELLKFALSWTVSLTIIATTAYYLFNHYEKKIHG